MPVTAGTACAGAHLLGASAPHRTFLNIMVLGADPEAPRLMRWPVEHMRLVVHLPTGSKVPFGSPISPTSHAVACGAEMFYWVRRPHSYVGQHTEAVSPWANSMSAGQNVAFSSWMWYNNDGEPQKWWGLTVDLSP